MANIRILRNKLKEAGQELKQLRKQVKRKEKEMAKIRKQIEERIASAKKEDINQLVYSGQYDSRFTWKDKIRVALVNLNEATVKEIEAFILKKEPTLNEKSMHGTVQRIIVTMVNKLELIKLSKYASKYKLNTKEA